VVKGWTFGVGAEILWAYDFSRFAACVNDWRPAFDQIVADFKEGEIKQFATEGQYGSGSWPKLNADYAKSKEETWPSRPILVASGLLRKAATDPKVEMTHDSLTLIINDAGSYQVFSKRAGGIVTVEKPAVAGFHQIGAGSLPRRAVVQLPAEQIVRWRKIFHSYMVYKHRALYGGNLGQ
jgi:hypothetical protein